MAVQALGLVATAVFLYGATQKNDRKLLGIYIAGSSLLIVHFILMTAWSAAVSETITLFRFYLSRVYRKNWVYWILVGSYVSMAALLAKDIFGILPFAGSIVATTGVFRFSGIPMRLCFLMTEILWVIYSVHIGSLGSILLNLGLFAITTTTIIRIKKSPSAEGDFKEEVP